MIRTDTALAASRNPALDFALEQIAIAKAAYSHDANEWTRNRLVRAERRLVDLLLLLNLA